MAVEVSLKVSVEKRVLAALRMTTKKQGRATAKGNSRTTATAKDKQQRATATATERQKPIQGTFDPALRASLRMTAGTNNGNCKRNGKCNSRFLRFAPE